MLQLVAPSLYTSLRALSSAGAKEYPALTMLYSRGHQQALESDNLEELICRQFGVTRQTDWPLAAITYAFDEGRPGSDYWLRADPVHVLLNRNKLILRDDLTLTADEAQALCNALAAHFGDTLAPRPMQPDRWYMRLAEDPCISTTPPSQAMGKPIDPLLPQGTGAMHWRKLLNEAQMLLFSHPVNQSRESRGQPTVNSLWLWGGGTLPANRIAPLNSDFYGYDFTATAVAKFAGVTVHALPNHLPAEIKNTALYLFNQLYRCWLHNDLSGLESALLSFETGWARPLIKAGKTFRIDDPVEAMSLVWHPSDRWKFWRKSGTSWQPELNIQPERTDFRPKTDEFGNRY